MNRIAATAGAFLLLAAPSARAEDGLFGSFFSRAARSEAPKAEPEARGRETEARNLRREYWERERARLSQAGDRGLANPASSRTAAIR